MHRLMVKDIKKRIKSAINNRKEKLQKEFFFCFNETRMKKCLLTVLNTERNRKKAKIVF